MRGRKHGGGGWRQIVEWEDGAEDGGGPSDPLAYALVMEYHHPILIMMGVRGVWIETDRYI